MSKPLEVRLYYHPGGKSVTICVIEPESHREFIKELKDCDQCYEVSKEAGPEVNEFKIRVSNKNDVEKIYKLLKDYGVKPEANARYILSDAAGI